MWCRICLRRAPSTQAPVSRAGAERRRSVAARGAVAVFAKQNAKQRERLAEKQRQYNKARKSAAATRMRKVCARGSSVPSRAS